MKKYFFLIVFVFFLNSLFGGTTGKIAGIVTDSETSESLAGVNIVVEGTMYGAASDNEGYFSIINLTPGKYNLVVTYIGYADYRLINIQVNIDLTSQITIKLKPEYLSTDVVEVIAHRPVIEKGMSNSQLSLESAAIEILPIKSVNDALLLQAGIESSSNGLRIRGGSADETIFMVDGLSTNDERENYPNTAISMSSVDYIQVQTGGFNAEYGQARSGIVNVITKTGDRSRYSGSFTIHYQAAAPKHFGTSIYAKDSYFNRPFYDPDVMWTGTNNGAWDDYTQNQYPDFIGWNNVAQTTLLDNDPSNDLTPEGALHLFSWYRRRNGDIKKPDYRTDFGFGGPVPILGSMHGNTRFHLSYFKEKEMFVFPLSVDGYSESQTQLKVTTDISPAIKLMMSGMYGEVESASLLDWTGFSRRIFKTTYDVANRPGSSSTGMGIPFMPGYFSPTKIYNKIFDLKFTHTLSNHSLYEVKVQYKTSHYNTYQTALRDTATKYEILPDYFVDEAPYGYWGSGVETPAGMPAHLGGWMNLERDKSTISTTSAFLSYSNQLNNAHFFKAGFSFVYNDFDIKHYSESPKNTWEREMIYNIFPFRIGAYLQDKMEFEGFIANVGLRFDYSDANTKKYTLASYDPFYSADYGAQIEELAPSRDSESSFTISPRLGISHPISEAAKLYFNYGHFRSEPFSSYRFRIQRESNGQVMYMGDPDLGQEKTVSYEAGYEHNLANQILVKIAGYYKDVSEQPGWIYYSGMNQVSYRKAATNNYADIRGMEITLQKSTGAWFSGFINYTYDVRTSGYFGLLEYHEDPKNQREYLLENPAQTRVHPHPSARLNLNVHTPDAFGPSWSNFYPMGSWMFNILSDWKTGRYDTFNPNKLPGIADNVQWRDWYNTDLRISKNIDVNKIQLRFFVDIRNVFNTKYMSYAGSSDYYDWQDYLHSLNFSYEKNEEHGNDKIGDYRKENVAYDPLEHNPNNDPEIKARNDIRKKNKSYIDMPNISSFTFLNPRSYTFGITISF